MGSTSSTRGMLLCNDPLEGLEPPKFGGSTISDGSTHWVFLHTRYAATKRPSPVSKPSKGSRHGAYYPSNGPRGRTITLGRVCTLQRFNLWGPLPCTRGYKPKR